MGCWNGTCVISNLPITFGEDVKLLFLYRPYGYKDSLNKSAYCYINDIFTPACFALNGKYDDYGGVENIEEDLNYKLFTDYLKTKYKEIKVEDEIRKDFTLYDIIEGIERGSLKVYAEGDVKRKKLALDVIEKTKEFSSEKVLEEWSEIANMDVSEKWRGTDLNFVMVRKDVWDNIIIKHKTEFWKDVKYRKHEDDYYQTANEWVENRFLDYKNGYKKQQELINKLKTIKDDDKYKINLVRDLVNLSYLENPMSTFGYAGGNSMLMMESYGLKMKESLVNSDETITDYFQKLFTEFTIIESFMNSTRKGWMITTGAGSQSNNWECYLLLNDIVNNICNEKLNE